MIYNTTLNMTRAIYIIDVLIYLNEIAFDLLVGMVLLLILLEWTFPTICLECQQKISILILTLRIELTVSLSVCAIREYVQILKRIRNYGFIRLITCLNHLCCKRNFLHVCIQIMPVYYLKKYNWKYHLTWAQFNLNCCVVRFRFQTLRYFFLFCCLNWVKFFCHLWVFSTFLSFLIFVFFFAFISIKLHLH